MYMTTEEDLSAAVRTAFVHTRRAAARCLRRTHSAIPIRHTNDLAADDGTRALRGLEWSWDPDPDDDVVSVEYVFMLRENGTVRAVHDRHIEGLFSKDTWKRLLTLAGYEVETFARPTDDGEFDECFVCRRPDGP